MAAQLNIPGDHSPILSKMLHGLLAVGAAQVGVMLAAAPPVAATPVGAPPAGVMLAAAPPVAATPVGAPPAGVMLAAAPPVAATPVGAPPADVERQLEIGSGINHTPRDEPGWSEWMESGWKFAQSFYQGALAVGQGVIAWYQYQVAKKQIGYYDRVEAAATQNGGRGWFGWRV